MGVGQPGLEPLYIGDSGGLTYYTTVPALDGVTFAKQLEMCILVVLGLVGPN